MKPPVYIGIFLTPSSRAQLLRDFPAVHENVFADHVTLVFRPKESDLANFDFGSIVRLKVVGYAQDQDGSAVLVDLPPEIEKLSQRNPHITISTAPGIKPFYSNKLISKPGNVERVSPKTYEGVIDGFPRNRRMASRVADQWLRSKLADLNPPLGHPGGTCKVVERIVDEVSNQRLEDSLVNQVQKGKSLSNPAARHVYDPERDKGAWKYKLLLTPHAQYRMDLRGITVPEIRAALDNFFRTMNAERSRGDTEKWDRFNRGLKIEWHDKRTNTFFVFTGGRNEVTIITTYRPGEPDPRPGAYCVVGADTRVAMSPLAEVQKIMGDIFDQIAKRRGEATMRAAYANDTSDPFVKKMGPDPLGSLSTALVQATDDLVMDLQATLNGKPPKRFRKAWPKLKPPKISEDAATYFYEESTPQLRRLAYKVVTERGRKYR